MAGMVSAWEEASVNGVTMEKNGMVRMEGMRILDTGNGYKKYIKKAIASS